jgi:Uma2 family endonuclease
VHGPTRWRWRDRFVDSRDCFVVSKAGKLSVVFVPIGSAAMNVAFVPEKMRISVDRYQKMVAAGVLTKNDRIELIEGEMINIAPIGSKHAALTARLTKFFVLAVGDTAILSPGGPVNLGDYSEPQPDLLLLRPRSDFYVGKIPETADILLLIEISDSTLAYDQGIKRALYARHGVGEYWIVDVEGKRIQIHREPTVEGYTRVNEFRTTDTVSPQALPTVQLMVQTLFT